MKPPTKHILIDEWRDTISVNFPEALNTAEVALSITAQLLINDIMHPFGLVIVGPPSSGKTTALNFFSELDGVSYVTDKFTASAFVSHALGTKASDLSKNDLLPKIRRKNLIVRDFATVFSKRDDDLRETIGVMTRVMDGEGLRSDTGPHGDRGYSGDYSFMFLAASTPIKKHTWQLMATLGSRLFYMQFQTREKTPAELMQQLSQEAPKVKEEKCRTATLELLRNLWHAYPDGIDWDRSADPQDCLRVIAQCAKLLASARSNPGTINQGGRQRYFEEYEDAVIEQPDRVSNLFYNLARSHALVCGRTQITRDDLWLVLRLTIDSMPPTRACIIKSFLCKHDMIWTDDVERLLKWSKPTATKYMKIMENLGICKIQNIPDGVGRPKQALMLNEQFKWMSSDEIKELYKSCNYRN